jgi:fatty-acyl-CoA synthase
MALIEAERPATATGSDGGALHDWVRALRATAPIGRHGQRLLLDVIEERAATCSDAAALLSAHERLTYRQLAERANAYARWALAQNLGKGEVVGLMMPNRPEYLAIWLGISRVGGVVALLNTHLRGAALAHCIDVAGPKHLIVADDFIEACQSAATHLSTRPKIWTHGADGAAGAVRIDRQIAQYSAAPLSEAEHRGVTVVDRALLIYTSGTTGLPKAANVSHRRILQWSFWFAGLMNSGPDDRMYDCLPMYHSIGGVVATGALLVNGGSVVIRDKFSAQNFWQDIRAWDCTLFQYIGELCRYLLNAPNDQSARAHGLRLACGNGLGADVWPRFQQRFNIPRILEFYAATEGNVSLYNVEGKVGAIGRVPSFLAHRFPLALVRFDEAAAEPARDADGFCIRSGPDEPGEAIGRINGAESAAQSGSAFEGYTSAKDSERKILRNVFKRGDAWYRTGDLMRRDANGFFYFVDRIGDTFRWKGENVAASEVAAALAAFRGIAEATVYGVAVPGTEGAAGMATLAVDGALDFATLSAHLAQTLPAYARPLFLRIKERIEVTATFKHKKSELKREGYDPAATQDAIYFDDPAAQAFVRLDAALYRRIQSGAIRL